MRDDALDPILQAAATAFGFIYIHPFQDGNGRLHRCLISRRPKCRSSTG
ncbi:MAG: Fic family protein [Gammaproteobacteria bacterium]|nr:Fic family protein [Gammaproteobacteria bacterium]